MVCTVDGAGWPHLSLVSHHELLATGPTALLLAMLSSSRTCTNLEARRRVTIGLVDEGMTYYVKGSAKKVGEGMGGLPVSLYRVGVREVLQDSAPGAEITSGIRFEEEGDPERHDLVLRSIRRASVA